MYSVLATIPGAHVNQAGIVFARCGYSGDASAKVQVYGDGARVTMGDDVNAVALARGTVHVSQIQAIEVYRGVAQIPAEFLYDACAGIAIWAKRGGK